MIVRLAHFLNLQPLCIGTVISQMEHYPKTPRRDFARELSMWACGLLGAATLWFLMIAGQFNLLCALAIGTCLLLVSTSSKTTAILLTFSYLILMGDIRRVVAVLIGPPAQDLLLLIAPCIAILFATPLILSLRLKDRLSQAMLLLTSVMLLEIFNPRQGGLTIGLSGAVFYLAPVLWFWIGRHFGAPDVIEKLLYRIIFPLSVVAALLGFVQSFFGFLPWEQAWIDIASKTYTALHLFGSIRPFGFSVSAAEYGMLLMLGTVGMTAAFFGSRRDWAVFMPVLVTAVILASGRSTVLRIVVALAVVLVLRKSSEFTAAGLVRLGLYALIGLVAVIAIASRFQKPANSVAGKTSPISDALAHQAGGLSHPLDPRYSTAGLHGSMFFSGVIQGLTYPIGSGLGSTTEGARKFGGDPSEGSSEIDLSDMFISLGLIGGILYLCVVIFALRQAFDYLLVVPRSISLPVIAMLICTLGSWLIGGQYSTSSFIFFIIGALRYDTISRVGESFPYVVAT